MFKHSGGMICHDVFYCTADLVGQLNGNGQKGMLQMMHPLSKISGYATARAHAAAGSQRHVVIRWTNVGADSLKIDRVTDDSSQG